MSSGNLPARRCASCGRTFSWRKVWERDWERVRYCSAACRKLRLDRRDGELEQTILDLLGRRADGATLCPSEAARVHWPETWRDHMERTRCAARRLVGRGEIEIVQRGRGVDPDTAGGPIRLRAVRGVK